MAPGLLFVPGTVLYGLGVELPKKTNTIRTSVVIPGSLGVRLK